MKRLFSILLAEVFYLVVIVLHFTGIARVLDHYTSTEYIVSVGAIIVFFLSRSLFEYLSVKARNNK